MVDIDSSNTTDAVIPGDGPFALAGAKKNTDRELWREGDREDDYYANSLHVTQGGAIGINAGGLVIVKRLHEWHAIAVKEESRAAAESYIAELEKRLSDVEDAARAVCWYDWSDCDEDVVEAFKRLREVLGPEQPIDDRE